MNVSDDLRALALGAARAFLGTEATLEPIAHGQSLACRVRAPIGDYLLRMHAPTRLLHTPEFSTPAAIESECAWLRALSDDTELVVQRPVPSPDGGYVLLVPDPDGGDALPCTLLSWVEGEHVEGKRSPEQAARLGELLAALHAHARTWEPPAGFQRPPLDTAAWKLALGRVDSLVSLGITSEAERGLLARVVERVDCELTPLEREPDRIGLIHADLHGANYVFHQGSPRPIDFGRAGIGPWLYDIAECAAHLGPQRRRDLVDAYARRRPLEEGDPRRIEGYFLASLVEVIGNNAHDPDEHDFLARAVPAWSPHFQRYAEGEPFLFEL